MTILYLSLSRLNTSVNDVYIMGLKQNNINVIGFCYESKKYKYSKLVKDYFKSRKKIDCIMIGYDSPQIIIALRLFTRKKIIYNALCSKHERLIVSRKLASRFSLKTWYYWLIDFLSFQLSDLIMLESRHQMEYIHKLFKISHEKLFLAWTGVNDQKFSYEPNHVKFERFTVLFRGRFLPEAGVEYAIQAAKKLENKPIYFLILGAGMLLPEVQNLIQELQPKNLKLITEFLPDDELEQIMKKSHIHLGQLGNHDRLNRTIPHKAYESLAMGIPYLTAGNKAVMELFTDYKTCLAYCPTDPNDLVEKILWAYEYQSEVKKIGEAGHKLFVDRLTPAGLATILLKKISC